MQHTKDGKTASLLFTLGNIQVFHYQMPDDILYNIMPYEVYWQDTKLLQVFGPFRSIYDAMVHYKQSLEALKLESLPNNIIYVDFFTKRRVSNV